MLTVSGASAAYLSHALSLQLDPFGALLVLVMGLAAVSLVATLFVVSPRIARVLMGKPRADEVHLSLGMRRLNTLAVLLCCAGLPMEGVGLIARSALLSNTGLALLLIGVLLILLMFR